MFLFRTESSTGVFDDINHEGALFRSEIESPTGVLSVLEFLYHNVVVARIDAPWYGLLSI